MKLALQLMQVVDASLGTHRGRGSVVEELAVDASDRLQGRTRGDAIACGCGMARKWLD